MRGRGIHAGPALLAAALTAFASCRLSAQTVPLSPPVRQFSMRSCNLDQFEPDLDGQWQGITMASDGNCYFGSSTHSARRGAVLFKFDPRSGEVTRLCDDVTRICGEDPANTPPQGKLHSPIVELDGWLYFGTHLANYWKEASEKYTGGHIVGYELATGKFRDLGIVHERYSIYSAVGLDRAHRRLYVHTVPFHDVPEGEGPHLWSVDIATARKTDLGRINTADRYSIFVDSRGDAWLAGPSEGSLIVARGETNSLEVIENVLPQLPPLKEGEAPRKTSLGIVGVLSEGERCLVRLRGDTRLWVFDPRKQGQWDQAFTPLIDFGELGAPSTPSIVAGGRLYFIRPMRRDTAGRPYELHLFSVALKPNATPADHGLILDQDGRRPWRIPSLAADDSGRIYTVGDWVLLTTVHGNGNSLGIGPGEKGSTRLVESSLRSGNPQYNELLRAQFFATGTIEHSAEGGVVSN